LRSDNGKDVEDKEQTTARRGRHRHCHTRDRTTFLVDFWTLCARRETEYGLSSLLKQIQEQYFGYVVCSSVDETLFGLCTQTLSGASCVADAIDNISMWSPH
jgi:hypothetical protein